MGQRRRVADRDERKLLQRLRRRDEAAFTELVRRYQDRVLGLTYRMLGNRAEAEDLAQEVFITVFKSIEGFRGDARLGTWIYRVTINHCKNRLKYLGRRGRAGQRPYAEGSHGSDAAPALSGAVAGPEASARGREMERLVQRAIAELPDDQRELVVLRDIESLSYDEIREITGLVPGTVKSRLHRARVALQRRVAELAQETDRGAGG
ncbi:MAG: sigma-70 family RNA polymerase sigma factor [Myxococcota bacterium]